MEFDQGKLFIGGISWETDEDRLREYFKTYGDVVETVIMKDRTTGRARGFGFVVFADPAVAERVVMQKHTIDGRMVEAKKAVPRDDQHLLNRNTTTLPISPSPARTKKIFVGGLASTVTEADFKNYFEQFGTINDVVVMYDHNTQRPRGFGFITYNSEDAVDMALLKTFHELNGKMVEVKRAVPKELSPGPNMRSPIGYNYGLNRINSFLNGYSQAYNPSSIGGYGMRTDGRFGPIASLRNGLPLLGPAYGMGLNVEPGLSPSYGKDSNYNGNLSYGRGLSRYHSGSSGRYSSLIGYGGGNSNSRSFFSSVARNVWGNEGLNYSTNSANSNAYMTSEGGSLGGFGNGMNWGSSPSSSISALVSGSGSGYGSGNLGFGSGENNFGLDGSSFGWTSGTSGANTSFTASSGGYDENYADLYGRSSVYADPTWLSASSEFDGAAPFGHVVGSAASDVMEKDSAGYIGGYNVSNRQPNRES